MDRYYVKVIREPFRLEAIKDPEGQFVKYSDVQSLESEIFEWRENYLRGHLAREQSKLIAKLNRRIKVKDKALDDIIDTSAIGIQSIKNGEMPRIAMAEISYGAKKAREV